LGIDHVFSYSSVNIKMYLMRQNRYQSTVFAKLKWVRNINQKREIK